MGGCHSSRLDHQNKEMLPKLPPLLSRKLEEIRSRRAAGSTPSTKQLLKDGYEDESASVSGHCNDRKSSVSYPEPDDNSVGYAKVAPQPTDPEELIFCHKKVIVQENFRTSQDNDNATNIDQKQALDDKEDVRRVEEYEKYSRLQSALSCPGSPSFRFYLDLIEPDKEDDHGRDDYMRKGSFSDTDVYTAEIAESPRSIEESEIKIKKRPAGRRGMRLRKVIPTGKKNFLNVVSCYNPSNRELN
ncbi:hypothetical protein PTKIN_Ptkin04bG0021800 [Pterospermum kingtungense]